VLALDDGADLALEIRGPSLTPDEEQHRRELLDRIEADPTLRNRVRVASPAPRADVPALIASVDAVVSPNEPRSGATLDKAVFEAAACARPVVSTNPSFAPLLGDLPLPLLAPPRNPAELARNLAALARARLDVRVETGAELRRRIERDHSLDHWADAVLALVEEVPSRRGTAGSARVAA
jgi:glycosyltransferase involved in cell wall biosynthesis